MWIKVIVDYERPDEWLVSATLHEEIEVSCDMANWYSVYTPRWTCTIYAIFSYNPTLKHVALEYVAYDEDEANEIFRQMIRQDNVNKVNLVTLDLPDTDIDTDSFS